MRKSFGIGHALVLALVARVRRVVEADEDEVLLGRALLQLGQLGRARAQADAEDEIGALQRLDAQRVAAVVLEVAREERVRPPGSRRSRPARRPPGACSFIESSDSSCIAPLRMMPLPAAMTGARASMSRFA